MSEKRERCGKFKCGEYNMLSCVRKKGHPGYCNYVVDHENDYSWNKKPTPTPKETNDII